MQNVEHSHLNVWTNSIQSQNKAFVWRRLNSIPPLHDVTNRGQIGNLHFYLCYWIFNICHLYQCDQFTFGILYFCTCLQTRSFKWPYMAAKKRTRCWTIDPINVTYPNSKHYHLIMTPLPETYIINNNCFLCRYYNTQSKFEAIDTWYETYEL